MTSSTFVHNLSVDTYEAAARRHLSPPGFLIAPQNARGRLKVLAKDVVASRRELMADNGNFATIGKIRREFADEATELATKVRAFEETLGRSSRRGELPSGLVRRFDSLDRKVRSEAKARGLSDHQILAAQIPLSPNQIIGAEDLTMATWLSLDIEPRYTSRNRRDYRRYNAAVAKRAVKVLSRMEPELAERYYPVASAVSYNTAVDAGREFAAAGIEAVSMGFGAYMADANFTDHMVVGRRRIDFGTRLPHRYIRTTAVAIGFWTGYHEVDGKAPTRFHFLGLGAPIMIPPVALVARRTPQLSFDATSPIKDATKGGTLYVDKPALLKIRTRKVAHRLAREPSHRWECPCPFCQAFVADHPFDYKLGHRWFDTTGQPKVQAKDLRPDGALFLAYPLLSEPSGGPLRKAVNYSRIGHNHWILERTIASLNRAARRDGLPTRVTNIISSYQRRTSPPFSKALQVALDMAGASI